MLKKPNSQERWKDICKSQNLAKIESIQIFKKNAQSAEVNTNRKHQCRNVSEN